MNEKCRLYNRVYSPTVTVYYIGTDYSASVASAAISAASFS